jgi:hypothetical protein
MCRQSIKWIASLEIGDTTNLFFRSPKGDAEPWLKNHCSRQTIAIGFERENEDFKTIPQQRIDS